MTSLATAQRAGLVAALRAVPADAPTLCAGWTARDLAAHVVARERRPDSMPGLLVPALAWWTDRVRGGYAHRPYGELIDLVASGPPWTSPFALPRVDAAANLTEFLVHTEDVRRAQPGWRPRELPAEVSERVWRGLTSRGRLIFRSPPVAITLARPDGPSRAVAGSGEPVTLTGEPVELLLYALGRRAHALVEVTGSDDAVRQLAAMRLGV